MIGSPIGGVFLYYTFFSTKCKYFILLFIAVVAFSVTTAYAYSVRLIPNFIFEGNFVYVAEDVSPYASSYSSVTVNYDDLADMVLYCNKRGLSSSLVYNSSINRYVGYVDDASISVIGLTLTSLSGLLCNVDGYIYVAEDPRANVSVSITTPTNPDYTDRLINIASNLDFLPIIAELNVLIADNQLLVMDYIKLAIEGIWDLQDSMIDRFDIVTNRLAYIGSRIASVDVHVVDISDLLSSVISGFDLFLDLYERVNGVSIVEVSADSSGLYTYLTDAAGGELIDLQFWGKPYSYGYNENIWYSLDDVSYTPNPVDSSGDVFGLKGLNLGSDSSNCPSHWSLTSGIWQYNGNYILSDTYDPVNGRITRRVGYDSSGTLVALSSAAYEYVDKMSISIPVGDSRIMPGFNLRMTFKYEQIGGVTSTSDIILSLEEQADRIIAALNTDTPGTTSTVDLTTIETTLSMISDKLDNTASNVENTVINITNDNDAYNVFYIEDEDGNTQSVTDFVGDLTGASGKLLSLLYRLVFADALDSVDSDLDNLEEFFTSEEPVLETASVGNDTTYKVVTDVWATS